MTVINNNNENNIYQTHYIHFYLNLRFDWLIINLFITHLRFFFYVFTPPQLSKLLNIISLPMDITSLSTKITVSPVRWEFFC